MTRAAGPPVVIVGFLGSETFGLAAQEALRAADVVLGTGRLLDALPADVAGKRIEAGGARPHVLGAAEGWLDQSEGAWLPRPEPGE